jgi:hypothetical protein
MQHNFAHGYEIGLTIRICVSWWALPGGRSSKMRMAGRPSLNAG